MSIVAPGQALVLVGGPATGKTARLDRAAAEADGLVLRASGNRLETDIPYAGLHQLLRPVLDRADLLPDRQRQVLGVVSGKGDPDRLPLGVAVLTLLSEISPVLLVVDDMQWLDLDSLRVLTSSRVGSTASPSRCSARATAHTSACRSLRWDHRPATRSSPRTLLRKPLRGSWRSRLSRPVRRGAYGTAARLLHRAGGSRRLLRAAELAIFGGYPAWGRELLVKVDDPSVRAEVALRRGQALALTPHRDAALRLLVDAAKELPEPLSSEAISSAAVVAYYTGRRDGIHSDSVWVRALTDPDSVAVAELREVPDMPEQLVAQATMAWLLDETSFAIEQFERARDLAQLPDPLRCAAGWAYLEAGQWASARLVAAASARIAADGDLPHTAAAAMTLDASVLALQREATQARAFAVDALAAVTPRASASVTARGRWALGMAAVADGDFEAAYDQFRMMFDDCGSCRPRVRAPRRRAAPSSRAWRAGRGRARARLGRPRRHPVGLGQPDRPQPAIHTGGFHNHT